MDVSRVDELPRLKVAASGNHSLFLNGSGNVHGFGDNSSNQLRRIVDPLPLPIIVPVTSNVESIYAEEASSFFLKNDHTVWGIGFHKILEIYEAEYEKSVSAPVAILSGVQFLAIGSRCIYHIDADGTLYGLGDNLFGQLGLPDLTFYLRPTILMHDVLSVAGGSGFALVKKRDNTLWSFGDNSFGQLGVGKITKSCGYAPTLIMSDVKSIYAGKRHSFVIKNDGTLWSFGLNENGQLGDGTYKTRGIPVEIMNDVISVATGLWHTLALTNDGALWSFGYNGSGQLGNGASPNQRRTRRRETNPERTSLPRRVLTRVTAIAAGREHSLVLREDATLWSFGSNNHGQLGVETKFREGALTPTMEASSVPLLVMSSVKPPYSS